ncbi:MAG: inorganic phosphate transporter [Desulfobacterales bacterium]
MDIFLFSVVILIGLAVFDLIVGVSNDAVNFLNSSTGSRVAPRYIIMIIASVGMLAGVTFSSGMMEVARKGIFHPEFFLMPELMTIFLAVMLTDILLLDFFNTFGLPTSTTVSIVFELLGAAVAVSLLKIFSAGADLATLVDYINTAKALTIILGILLSVVVAFLFGALIQFISRLVFTFDYEVRLKRYGGIWGGMALAIISYFILIKGAKGTSFLSTEAMLWIDTHTWTILSIGFAGFAVFFQGLILFTRINILKPIVIVGTFALAMAFAANDLVNFIGVPLAGLSAYRIANLSPDPMGMTMEALQKPVQSNTLLLLIAGVIMVLTLWTSRKARSVTQTEISLGRQDEGTERFGASTLSRIVVRMVLGSYAAVDRFVPAFVKRTVSERIDPGVSRAQLSGPVQAPYFDLVRASVNLMVASAVVSFATSLKLPLSTTYVTFMVAMGSSLADQAWGRESAVYRVTGVLTVIGGWFFTAFVAFTVASIFAFLIYVFDLPAIMVLLVIAVMVVVRSYRYHYEKEKETSEIEAFSLKNVDSPEEAISRTFEQTGIFLKDISDTLGLCIEAAFNEDRQRLKDVRAAVEKIEKWSNVIIANIFKTLFLLHKCDISDAQKYSHTIRSLQAISEGHRDIVLRVKEHFDNYHIGFNDQQKEELRFVKVNINRLLWNTSIMLLNRKKVDYDYISNQLGKLQRLIDAFDKNQISRIQEGESKTRLSILFYGIMDNCSEIAEHTCELLDIFKDSFNINGRISV